MTQRLRTGNEHAFDLFGRLLIRLVARLARPAYVPHPTRRQPVRRFLARRAIDGIVAIGRIVDRLSGYSATQTKNVAVSANRPVFTR